MSKAQKHKPKGADNPKGLTTGDLENRAKADMSRQNYRRAKEWLKELCKRNREEHLPQLILCYRGLAAQMEEKGQWAEAKTVYDQIRLLGGEVTDALVPAARTSPAGDIAASRHDEIQPLATDADALVLASADRPDPGVYGELAAVHRALERVCAEQYPEALRELRQIGLKSAFAGWRLFIKGLCAYYRGDDTQARGAFRRLADEPFLSGAARPFLYILQDESAVPSRSEAKEPLLTQVCTVLGRKDLAHVLPRAEYLWLVGRYPDSYEHVARTLPVFPAEEPGLAGTLSRFYFNAVFRMDERRVDKYLDMLRHVADKKKRNAVDKLMFSRVLNLCLETDDEIPPREIMMLWEQFLNFHERLHGMNAKLRALVFSHLGDLFSQEEERDPVDLYFLGSKKRKSEIRHFRQAEAAYQKSLELNGADQAVHLSLLGLYEKTGEMGKRNKKLDEISRLFPDNKEALVRNGLACIERKAFLKGIAYLKKAAGLDPLDRLIKENLVIAYIQAARHAAGKDDARHRYREFMEEAMALGAPESKSCTMGRPYLRLRLAALESIAGCAEEGNRLLEAVLKDNGERAALTYFAYLIGRIYSAPKQGWMTLEKRLPAELKDPTPPLVVRLTEILEYIDRLDLPKFWMHKEYDRVNRLALEAAKRVAAPEEAERIIAYANRRGPQGWQLATRYLRAGLEIDPRHPLFLYLQYMEEKNASCGPPTASDLKRLQDILAIAVERNNRAAINLVSREIRDAGADSPPEDRDGDDGEPKMSQMDAINTVLERLDRVFQPRKPREPSPSRKKKARRDDHQVSLFDDVPF